MSARVVWIFFLFASSAANALAGDPKQIRTEPGSFVGSIGCKSSSCHGGAGPKRSQYITWSQKDFHTKAYPVLLNSRSTRIAEALGISDATTSVRCTVCHSPFQSVAQSKLTPAARKEEGVSCESCHGAAAGWLRGHTRTDWTYATRVTAGMHDLRNLYLRANACVACHQNLAPEILQAGHPDLFFELDGQSVAQPKHWSDNEPWSGLHQWLTGQAVALREVSWALAGDPQINEWSRARWDGLVWLCATTTSAAHMPSPIVQPASDPTHSDFISMQTQADALAHRATSFNWNEGAARDLLAALASVDGEFSSTTTPAINLAQRARRLVLALDRLTTALAHDHRVDTKVEAELNRLFEDVRVLALFDAKIFADHLKSFRAALGETT